jgi:hypothetical protein
MSYKDPIKNRAEVKKYRDANKEKVSLAKKNYIKNNKEKVNTFFREYSRKNYPKKMFITAQARARKKGLEFSLVVEDIVFPDLCPYLGVKMEVSEKRQGRSSPSLDRIDSTKGYTKENIRVISWLANTMKNNASRNELITFAKNVLRLHEAEEGAKDE